MRPVWFYFFCFVPLALTFSLWPEDNPDQTWEFFLKNRIPRTHVQTPYNSLPSDSIEEEMDSEMQFEQNRCKYESIKNLAEITERFSRVDALLLLRNCRNLKDKNLRQTENQAKQQIFALSKFAKLEIIRSEPNDIELNESLEQLTKVWEERTYQFSNFYHKHTLLWLGEEKELTEEINRIVYLDMNPSRKLALLKKMREDIALSNKRLYHFFQYSQANPWEAQSLLEENQNTKSRLLDLLREIKQDQNLFAGPWEAISHFEECIEKLNIENPKIRLTVFIGFWQDYEIFYRKLNQRENKETLAILKFLKKNTLNSHHFVGRLYQNLSTCQIISNL
jgi:hypothetical protein